MQQTPQASTLLASRFSSTCCCCCCWRGMQMQCKQQQVEEQQTTTTNSWMQGACHSLKKVCPATATTKSSKIWQWALSGLQRLSYCGFGHSSHCCCCCLLPLTFAMLLRQKEMCNEGGMEVPHVARMADFLQFVGLLKFGQIARQHCRLAVCDTTHNRQQTTNRRRLATETATTTTSV